MRIGGVPEHFNLPWRRLLEADGLGAAGIDASWQDFPGGTGSMVAELNEGRLDLAMLLTEGAVAGIANGGSYRIVSLFNETPLIWGVHVPAGSELHTMEDVRGARYAVSRYGSGSHLMAFALSEQMGWPVRELKFEVVGNLEGALAAFAQQRADVFMWEKFMTQPLVDAGRFRRVDEFVAPWPAFVACASARALDTKATAVATALELVFRMAAAVSVDRAAPAEIAARYGLSSEDAAEWLRITRWADEIAVDAAPLTKVLHMLGQVGLAVPQAGLELIAPI